MGCDAAAAGVNDCDAYTYIGFPTAKILGTESDHFDRSEVGLGLATEVRSGAPRARSSVDHIRCGHTRARLGGCRPTCSTCSGRLGGAAAAGPVAGGAVVRVIVRGLLQDEGTVSRRALLGGLASFASVLELGGCADVGAVGAHFDASSFSLDPTLLVTTTRKPVNGGRAKPWFGPERASTMTIARAKLVPPDDGRFSLGGPQSGS